MYCLDVVVMVMMMYMKTAVAKYFMRLQGRVASVTQTCAVEEINGSAIQLLLMCLIQFI
jgi:hypothetical protein